MTKILEDWGRQLEGSDIQDLTSWSDLISRSIYIHTHTHDKTSDFVSICSVLEFEIK